MPENSADRLRLLHDRGRLGRSLDYGGVRYWIGRHRKLGLLIFDPHAQLDSAADRVRLFSVSRRTYLLFSRSAVKTRGLWASFGPDTALVRREMVRYARYASTRPARRSAPDFRRRRWEGVCHACQCGINSSDFPRCPKCRWIQCQVRKLRLRLVRFVAPSAA